MTTARTFALSALLLSAACTDPSENFVGTYKTSLTLSGTSSQTYPDTLAISSGDTADLIISSQQLGAVKASIIGDTSFSIDSQMITLTDTTGKPFSVSIQGQGTVSDGVLGASGQLLGGAGVLSIMMNGSRQ